MKNALGILKLSSKSILLIIAEVLDGSPVLIYKKEVPLNGEISRDRIVDRDALIEKLSSLIIIEDQDANLRINAKEISLILPPIGFDVYSNEKITNVIDSSDVIEAIDITNVVSMVKKEVVPNNGRIVDIIPDNFILSDGSEYVDPPLGKISHSLSIRAKVHTLSKVIYDEYVKVVEEAGFFIKRYIISSFASSALIKKDLPNIPSYFLLDIGHEVSYISLIGNYSLFATNYFNKGEHDLITKIAVALGISERDASDFVHLYGLRDRKLSYRPKILSSEDQYGDSFDIYPGDIAQNTSEFFDDYIKDFISAFNLLTKDYDRDILTLPLVVIGAVNDLCDIENKFNEKLTNFKKIIFYTPKVIGARKASLVDALGGSIIVSSFRGSMGDQSMKVAKVERVEKKGKEKR